MRDVVLFIAMSLDGYIADSNGKVDWLKGQNENEEKNDSYSAFVNEADTVIMGWKTYFQIVTELSPEEWVYSYLKSYVITHREAVSTDIIEFTSEDPCDLVRKLKQENGKNIWICGGSDLIRQLMKEDLIDVYYISVIPIILGNGIPLFEKTNNEIKLQLIKTHSCNGITELIYKHR